MNAHNIKAKVSDSFSQTKMFSDFPGDIRVQCAGGGPGPWLWRPGARVSGAELHTAPGIDIIVRSES